MPTWICPFCEAEMTVKPQLVGQVRACPKCEQESTITDAAVPAPARLPPRQSRQPDPQPAESESRGVSAATAVALGNVENTGLTSVMLAQGLLVIVALASALMLLFGFSADAPAHLIPSGLGGLISVVISWPIYSIANESYRSRKLLEEILRSTQD